MFIVYDDLSHNLKASKVFRRTNAGDYCSPNWDETVDGGLTTTAIISVLRQRALNETIHGSVSLILHFIRSFSHWQVSHANRKFEALLRITFDNQTVRKKFETIDMWPPQPTEFVAKIFPFSAFFLNVKCRISNWSKWKKFSPLFSFLSFII